MAARLSAKRLPRYSLEFKEKVMKLPEIPGRRSRWWQRLWTFAL